MPADVHLHQLRASHMPALEDAEIVQLQVHAFAYPGSNAGISAGALVGVCSAVALMKSSTRHVHAMASCTRSLGTTKIQVYR